MEFLVNDLSIDGQFPDVTTFKGAISRIMAMRRLAIQFGRELYCHRNIAYTQVTRDISMQQAIQSFDRDQRQSLIQWFTRQGPFWEDARGHSPDDYLECNRAIVTDTAIGEAAWNCLNGVEQRLVSLMPSNWEFTPIQVNLVKNTGDLNSVDVVNHWDPATFEAALLAAPAPLVSWGQTAALAQSRFTLLTFSADAFAPLNGYPFVIAAAQRILVLLDVLNRLKSCFDENGQRTPAGHEIYRDFFTGKKGDGGRGALFSDSSDTEKAEFKTEMTFTDPADNRKTIFCPWHGKVQTPQFRVHFSSPIRADEPLNIVYVGLKITKH